VGLILDSAVIIAAERLGQTVRQILEQIHAVHGEIDLGLSVVSVVELTHGIQRAKDEKRRKRRQAFVDELIRDILVHPVTVETAKLAGQIEGQAGRSRSDHCFRGLADRGHRPATRLWRSDQQHSSLPSDTWPDSSAVLSPSVATQSQPLRSNHINTFSV
jgi:predicted nucleic acid-binding protein